ncbi:MAG TPA: hypothetical protein VHB73_04255 [Alphaproteobacteria bacterium]|nr:hypothetical protein [Alphaproteobacteria bacterium]
MNITLSPDQQKSLEAQVAAGRFASIEEAVRFAVSHFLPVDTTDLSWAVPYLEEARMSLSRGESLSLKEFKAHAEKRLSELD